ncbi:tubulointerstitial nephritis antigen-like isoform X2 [Rhodnius prolixus]|uniref:tubulointerstitial nephritis antigen-like isoform X2 n=1 Tax=Rhodnius prolixus TaxID=13249 RepID=UPI003D1897EB
MYLVGKNLTILLTHEKFKNKRKTTMREKKVITASLYLGVRAQYYGNPGYCQQRSEPKCCDGREDRCSVPNHGSLCYCDIFCHKARDCCEDMNSTCYGKPAPPKLCYWNERYIEPNNTFEVYCNMCICEDGGSFMNLMCSTHTCIIDDKLIEDINRIQNEWKASKPEQFRTWKLNTGMNMLLGTFKSRKKVADMLPKFIPVRPKSLPKYFDARERWPNLITSPPNQGCGASWVFSTVSVASDRWNIMSNGTFRGRLSFQHLLSCNKRNNMGCKGGHLTKGWNWIHDFGLVKEECYKWTGDSSRCYLPKHKGAPSAACLDDGRKTRTKLYYTAPVYRIASDQYQIMKEIMDNGPVQATMDVFRDLFLYESGIYSCPLHYKRSQISSISPPIRDYPGYHSVRIVGWGQEIINGNMIKYWIVSNSWGEFWGEGGYFRIRRGTNSCNIETFILAPWIHEN